MEDFGGMDNLGSEQIDQAQSGEQQEGIKQAEIQRVKEGSEKAKKVAQQIHASKQTNHKFADFLAFLIQAVKDEEIIKYIYEVFFKTLNPKDNIKYIKKNVNFLVVVGIFAPFYPEETKHYGVYPYYEKLRDFNQNINIQNYLIYIKKLSATYHDNIPVSKADFLNFLIKLIIYYKIQIPGLTDQTEITAEALNTQIYQKLEQELF